MENLQLEQKLSRVNPQAIPVFMLWKHDGAHYYELRTPDIPEVIESADKPGQFFVVVGHADDCRAHQHKIIYPENPGESIKLKQ